MHHGRLYLIDLPQIVDVVANPPPPAAPSLAGGPPLGPEFLRRDCENVCTWFVRRGLQSVDLEYLYGDLVADALAGW